MKAIILDPAEDDLDEVVGWYEDQQAGLGQRFLDEFEMAIERIERFPKSHAKIYRTFRIAPLRKFPYGIFYSIGSEYAFVQAVVHLRRSRRFWKNMLKR